MGLESTNFVGVVNKKKVQSLNTAQVTPVDQRRDEGQWTVPNFRPPTLVDVTVGKSTNRQLRYDREQATESTPVYKDTPTDRRSVVLRTQSFHS